MAVKPTYEELEKRIAQLEQEHAKYQQALAALDRSEESYRSLFEYSPVGIAVYRAIDDGKKFVFLDFNREAEKISSVTIKSLPILPGFRQNLSLCPTTAANHLIRKNDKKHFGWHFHPFSDSVATGTQSPAPPPRIETHTESRIRRHHIHKEGLAGKIKRCFFD